MREENVKGRRVTKEVCVEAEAVFKQAVNDKLSMDLLQAIGNLLLSHQSGESLKRALAVHGLPVKVQGMLEESSIILRKESLAFPDFFWYNIYIGVFLPNISTLQATHPEYLGHHLSAPGYEHWQHIRHSLLHELFHILQEYVLIGYAKNRQIALTVLTLSNQIGEMFEKQQRPLTQASADYLQWSKVQADGRLWLETDILERPYTSAKELVQHEDFVELCALFLNAPVKFKEWIEALTKGLYPRLAKISRQVAKKVDYNVEEVCSTILKSTEGI